jgi:amphi-Trp domain-containing protein
MSKQEIEIKTALGREEASRYLQELAQCLAGGKIVVQRGGEYVELRPQHGLELEIEATRKKDKEKISLELSWRVDAALEQGCELKICAEAPAPVELLVGEEQPPVIAPSPSQGCNAGSPSAECAGPDKDKAPKGGRK